MPKRKLGATRTAAAFLLPALLLTLLLPACSEKESPETRVRSFVARAEEAAEARDLAAIKELISEDYRDDDGRNRRGVMGLLAVHFMQNQSVHLLTRVGQIRFGEDARAEVAIFVAMAGTPIPEADELRRVRADLYRFDVRLAETSRGEWRLLAAEWKRAGLSDFL